ncbi:DUF5777 family beta-barrel protein [Natronogracilivirga saccharolytica]|uniref:DUF5777 domain-containing protein n=1 Tax=Natronogracilivirga saccharolytica TaxID=2812953 RepID=A0A8J7UTI7_9BACT|nr:DUF5777 family beta-barrel protein [Natronogracilivirga saccharolytica]MBP3191375.1 hypothetical protein [Natronogracilivirga saccharolytica]
MTGVAVRYVFFAVIFVLVHPHSEASAVTGEKLDENIFWANTNVVLPTVYRADAGTMRLSVKHTFGHVDGGIDRFFGLDDGANTRLGLEYGFTDRFSAGLGRMTFRNVVDLHAKYTLFTQSRLSAFPFETALFVSSGIDTRSGQGLEFSDRLSYLTSLMIARSLGDFRFQLSPMFAHYNFITGGRESQLFGLGISAKYLITSDAGISGEFAPVLGSRNSNTSNALSIGLHFETEQLTYQVYLAASQWHNAQFIMSENNDRFWEGDIRIGFNINRKLFSR